MAEALLGIEVLVFLLGLRYIFTRDRLFGFFYLFLFVYALPAQLGYHYLSELSALMVGYFGDPVWYSATIFIVLSLLSFWVSFALFRGQFLRAIPIRIRVDRNRNAASPAVVAIILLGMLLLYELVYLAGNYDQINWYTAQDEDYVAANRGYFLFIFILKLMVAVGVTLYAIVRQRGGVLPRRLQTGLFLVAVGVFLATSYRLGNRTDILAFFLGVAVFESSRVRFSPAMILKAALACVVVFAGLSLIELSRYGEDQQELDLAASLLAKDYYAPAHMLFAAMADGLIDPLEVLLSNVCNSLMLLKYPFLQITITEGFKPGVATRSAGYAFYVFTEGYMVLGPAGFLYNGFVLMLGLSFWRKLARTNSVEFNLFLLAIMGCMLVNLVRGQTSYFIKYLYMFVLPGVLLYCALAGVKLRLVLGYPPAHDRSAQSNPLSAAIQDPAPDGR